MDVKEAKLPTVSALTANASLVILHAALRNHAAQLEIAASPAQPAVVAVSHANVDLHVSQVANAALTMAAAQLENAVK